TPPYTAYLKIAEGCNNRCTYCAIPLIRGPLRSIEQEPLLEQARALVENGVKELIVVAQDTTAYGVDRGRRELPEFLEKLCEIEGLKWIRMLYCYPDKIDDALLQTMKKHDKILPYLDIPIQHADGGVLRAMHRPGDYDSLMGLIENIRAVLPDVVLRTTLIVGFPGETQEQFETLCRFVKAARFDKLGVFAYSPEEGTPAAEMENQIDEDEKARRLDIIMQLQAAISAENLEKKVGSVLDVLVEEYDEESECFVGRSYGDAPDIDGKVFFHAHQADEGDILPIRITAALDYDLIGEIEE
ncbi:MAG: 30S ribosomal protein S12 methylthiotransferase RimO, partial [Clostridia bacterium]|nr:30S ribosomal protein S12 methylthiotransferase RimO [Clostridia bacterium]